MIRANENYLKLKSSYLFSDIRKRVETYQKANPDKEIIRLGIGDVTRPLPPACIKAFHEGVDEMAEEASFKGYGPEQGYLFLREKIAREAFQENGIAVSPEEIFISDGSKCDTGNFQELFSKEVTVAIPNPVYPVYLDSNIMAGRTGLYEAGRYNGIVYLDCVKENDFLPGLPGENADLVYLCFPNNPTGSTATRAYLEKWVAWAKENRALILYDAAYESFVRDDGVCRSIYEIEGADKVAVEFRSFSKTAGFTGTRCAYTIVPKSAVIYTEKGEEVSLHGLWHRRQSTKFNGVSYPVQKAAAAVYSAEGKNQVRELVSYYLGNADIVTAAMEKLGFAYAGGRNSPYIWVDGNGRDSWEFFDLLLRKAGVVCTPGAGFGKCGNRYIRISAFNSRENVEKAVARFSEALA